MESGDKMTEEERRKWIDILMDKTMKVHEQKKHYVNMSVTNVIQGTIVSIYVTKNGLEKDEMQVFINPVLWIFFRKNFQK